MSIALYRPATTFIRTGGVAVVPVYGPVEGGFITNPLQAEDQGLDVAEVLFVNITGVDAGLIETPTNIPLQPGQTWSIPPGQTTNVSVNAVSTGHKFSGVILQPPSPAPAPVPGTFPPSEPTTLTETIQSYLYEQYNDDEALQAFVEAFNSIAQEYVSWFANIGLPVYTGPEISGALLDWIALGLYGMARPSLSSGRNRDIGPLNTYRLNTLGLNTRRVVGPQNVTITTDDIFKRIMTWNFYKGDGNVFNVRWLKRRIMRFLDGVSGTAPNVDETYRISVTFGDAGLVSIRIATGTRILTGGALLNRFRLDSKRYNQADTLFQSAVSPPPLAPVLKEAIESSVLQLPFQNSFSVQL